MGETVKNSRMLNTSARNLKMFCLYVLLVVAGRAKVPQGSFVKM